MPCSASSVTCCRLHQVLEVVGAPASGKTQLCYCAAASASLAGRRGERFRGTRRRLHDA